MRAIVRICAGVMTLLLAVPAWADVPVPDTPAGRLTGLWLEAFNSCDAARIKAFHDTYAPQLPPERDIDFSQRTGGFDILKVEQSQPLHLVALLRERNSETVGRMEVEVSDGATPQIQGFGIRAIPTPAEFAVVRLGEAGALSALTERMDQQAHDDVFSGEVMVAKGDRIVFDRTVGWADRATRTSVTGATQFRIGSMNKMFTAVAVLQLVEQGKVSLDAPVGTYLTSYPNADIAARVTVRQLLTHSGGTGDIFGPDFDAHRGDLKTLNDYVALYGARAPEFTPGSRFSYSNYGYILLGAIIEAASGGSYYDYVDAHIFKPAAMTQTGYLPEDVAVPNRSAGYVRQAGQWVSNAGGLPYRGTSAGGGYSTAGDLVKFAQALQDGRLLSANSFAMAASEQIRTDHGGAYGFGFEVDDQDGVVRIGHGGGAPGMNGDLRIYPNSGYIVVSLSNFDPPAAQRLSDFIASRLPAGRGTD